MIGSLGIFLGRYMEHWMMLGFIGGENLNIKYGSM